MADVSLKGCRILVVEDEYLLAEELRAELEAAQVVVIGPVGQLEPAIALIAAQPRIDGAVLDVNLGGDSVFRAADLLLARGVPVVFTTGYDAAALPERYAHLPLCEKPVSISKVAQAIGHALVD
ncbi:response regulator [Caulobacter sp. 73W]|uniref:Response regulator n=1 Tax=Caulobacter sp. 73W TaxID=3161137 RepID=A0AB39KXB0_9CAUL